MADHGDPMGDRLRQLYELFLQRRRAWKDERSRVRQMGTVVAYLNLSYALQMLAANLPVEDARVRQMAIVLAQLNQSYVRKRHKACREATRLLELEMVLAEHNHAYAQSRREEETGTAAGPEGDNPGVANAAGASDGNHGFTVFTTLDDLTFDRLPSLASSLGVANANGVADGNHGVANAPEDDANDNPGVPNAPDCRDGQA